MARCVLGLLAVFVAGAWGLHVACVGDSITWGFGQADPRSYPGVLGRLLGSSGAHTATNFGVSGTTMMKKGDHPYWSTAEYSKALASNADVVVIQLGTNDAKTFQWDEAAYTRDYLDMVAAFRAAAVTKVPRIVLSIPPPLYKDGVFKMNQTVINSVLPPLIHRLAATTSSDLVDVFDHLGTHELTHSAWFSDGCHPNADGYEVLGEVIFAHVRPW
jgi:lysophospholipase L1-like esterase